MKACINLHALFDTYVAVVGRGVQAVRVMSGLFMTSLEMAGVSLSLMTVNDEILRLFGEFSLFKFIKI